MQIKKFFIFADHSGELAEWSNAVVLKTIVPKGTGGSNPSLSAEKASNTCFFFINFFVYFFKIEIIFIADIAASTPLLPYFPPDLSIDC